MIQLQFLNAVLDRPELYSVMTLTDEMFSEYEAEFKYIREHYEKYGNVPDKATFASKFKDFEFIAVRETDKYLIDELTEDTLYRKTVPIILECEKKLRNDSVDAAKYLLSKVGELQPKRALIGEDFRERKVQEATKRIDKFWLSGLSELDEICGGWQAGEDLITVVGRLGQGKTWIMLKNLAEAYKQGANVGVYSGEMSKKKVMWRIDSFLTGISNRRISSGKFQDDEEEAYKDYLAEIKTKKNGIFVCVPKDFGHRASVSDLREFVKSRNIDILGIDHYGLMQDDRGARNKTERLENIVQDLWDLSQELGIPIIALAQSNRDGAQKEDGPEAENISGSDAIGQFSSKIISIKQVDKGIAISVKKNRDNSVGQRLVYLWDIDTGKFTYVPSEKKKEKEKIERVKKQFNDAEDVF